MHSGIYCMHSGTFWNILHAFCNILEHSACILEHSGTFCMHSGTFCNILHAFWNNLEHSGTFWNILKHSGTFWNIFSSQLGGEGSEQVSHLYFRILLSSPELSVNCRPSSFSQTNHKTDIFESSNDSIQKTLEFSQMIQTAYFNT